MTGARPDTAFARDVFQEAASNIAANQCEILPGSEMVMLEVRDRRNPEVISRAKHWHVSSRLQPRPNHRAAVFHALYFGVRLSAEPDSIVVTYEHRATGMNSTVYTARARKNFSRLV